MDLLSNLGCSRVMSDIPTHSMCQPIIHSNVEIVKDPFADMINLSEILSEKDNDSIRETQKTQKTQKTQGTHKTHDNHDGVQLTVHDFITRVLFALDGTLQLLSKGDIDKHVSYYINKTLANEVIVRDCLKNANVRWPKAKIDRINLNPKAIASPELVEFMSFYLKKTMVVGKVATGNSVFFEKVVV